MKKTVSLVFLIVASTLTGLCSTLVFDSSYASLGHYASSGLMYWGPGWTFNGVVTTPPDYYRQVSADINLYTEQTNSHTLFIQVEGVVGSHFSSAFGGAFDALTIVGIQVSDPQLSALTPAYSGQFANQGEYLEGTLGDCSTSQNVPISSTPGWNLASANSGNFTVGTVSGSRNGFTGPWGCIYGTYRIINGGVFALDFGTNLNAQTSNLGVSVIYGYNFQTIQAQPVPEPATLLTVACGLIGAVRFGRRRLSM